MRIFSTKIVIYFIALLTLFFVVSHLKMGLIGFLADSEIWSINLAKNYAKTWSDGWVITRVLYYSILAAFTAFASDSVSVFTYAKIAGVINTAAILVATFFLAKSIQRNKSNQFRFFVPILAAFFLVTNSGFFNQGYRIRSDLFALTFVMYLLILLVKNKLNFNGKIGFLGFCAMLCTPKAIAYFLPLIFAPEKRKVRFYIILSIFSFSVLAVGLYPQILDYVYNSYNANSNLPFFSFERFYHFDTQVKRNNLFWALFALRPLSYYFSKTDNFNDRANLRAHEFLLGYTWLYFLIFMASPEKVPYFLACCMPFIAIQVALFFEDLILIKDKIFTATKYFKLNDAIYLVLVIVIASISNRARIDKTVFETENSNIEQFEYIAFIEKFISNYPGARYEDIIGIIPSRSSLKTFTGPNDYAANDFAFQNLIAEQPDILLYVNKATFLEPFLTQYLNTEYYAVAPSLYARIFWFNKNDVKPPSNLSEEIKSTVRRIGLKDNAEINLFYRSKTNKTSIKKISVSEIDTTLRRDAKTISGYSPIVELATYPSNSVLELFKFDFNY